MNDNQNFKVTDRLRARDMAAYRLLCSEVAAAQYDGKPHAHLTKSLIEINDRYGGKPPQPLPAPPLAQWPGAGWRELAQERAEAGDEFVWDTVKQAYRGRRKIA